MIGFRFATVRSHMDFNWQTGRDLVWTGVAVTVAILAGLILHRVLYWLARRFIHLPDSSQHLLISRIARAAGFVLPFILVLAAFPALPVSRTIEEPATHALLLCLIAAVAWLVIRLIGYGEHLVTRRYQINVQDNLAARRIRTQVELFRRIAEAAVLLATVAVMLMTFPAIWSVGASMLASAGVAGLVAGIAAKPALSNLLAGMQIALTEPIRIDDVVIVEGEWGRIEEVNTTYVVVCTWDLRRLIVPLTHFIEKPFQNWTRRSADLIGTVFLHTDYTVPVDEVRNELRRVLEANHLWDRKVCALQVTDAKEHTIELRALVSAANASMLWDLRCAVREALIRFLQEHYSEHLPRTRADIRHWTETNGNATVHERTRNI
jgi:small-conductance mechanosensitive channel